MLCQKVIDRLNKKLPLDSQLLNHIQGCSDCLKHVKSDEVLQSLFRVEKLTSSKVSSDFAKFKQKVEAQFDFDSQKEHSLMSEIKQKVTMYPGISFGFVIIISITVLVLLLPFSYDKDVAYNVSFSAALASDDVPLKYLDKLADSLGYNEAVVGVTSLDDDKIYFINDLPGQSAAREVALLLNTDGTVSKAADLSEVEEGSSTITLISGNDTVIRLDATDKTDNELADEIGRQLYEAGYLSSKVEVLTTEGELKDIIIMLSDSTCISQGEAMMEIITLGDEIVFSMPNEQLMILNLDLENKSDSVIIDEVTGLLKTIGKCEHHQEDIFPKHLLEYIVLLQDIHDLTGQGKNNHQALKIGCKHLLITGRRDIQWSHKASDRKSPDLPLA